MIHWIFLTAPPELDQLDFCESLANCILISALHSKKDVFPDYVAIAQKIEGHSAPIFHALGLLSFFHIIKVLLFILL